MVCKLITGHSQFIDGFHCLWHPHVCKLRSDELVTTLGLEVAEVSLESMWLKDDVLSNRNTNFSKYSNVKSNTPVPLRKRAYLCISNFPLYGLVCVN